MYRWSAMGSSVRVCMCGGPRTSLGSQILVRAGLELAAAVLGAERVGAPVVAQAKGLCAVDLHPADRIGDSAARGEVEERQEHGQRDDVQRQLVVDLDRAEDVVVRRPRRGDQADGGEQ